MPADAAHRDLVDRIRRGDEKAWQDCIAMFEGRLLAFVRSRLKNRSAAEDIVQEAFIGFLTSLPNYDAATPLENFLFAITSHKLTDHLRREGRRPALQFTREDSTQPEAALPGPGRVASSLARSRERKGHEEQVLADCLRRLINRWKERGEWERLMCLELLFVRGLANKQAARMMQISEQAVANHKHYVLTKLKEAATQARLKDFNIQELGSMECP